LPDVAVIGAGGIGGYYGARLAAGGCRVHFYARSDADAMRARGLSVESIYGDFSIAEPLVYDRIEAMPPADLVLVCVKATANEAVFPQLAPVLREGATVVLMQNGFGAEARLRALYPAAHVLGGMCFICSFRVAPGQVRHTAYGKLTLAPAQADDRAAMDAAARLFAEAGVEVECCADLAEGRWRKLVWNIPYNGLTAVLRCKTDRLAQDPALRALVRATMEEVVGAAAACGTAIEPSFVDEMMAATDRMVPYEPSMRLDQRAGRPLETEAIYGAAIAEARRRGYEMKYANAIRLLLEAQP